jgi:RPA family protein
MADDGRQASFGLAGEAPGQAGRPKGARAAFQREVAHRAFAQEFNAARTEIKGQGEKDPSFVVTPLGAKVNRLHVVGVCTDVEPVGESGGVWRARISDPTGVFTVYAGQYQPEAAQALSQMQPPCFVAVTGKARTYEPEPGSMFVSIRPEVVTVVDEEARDQWILDTARRTRDRLRAVQAVRDDPKATAEGLVALGHSRAAAEGALLAQQSYGLADVSRYGVMLRQSLGHLLPGGNVPVHRVPERGEAPSMAAASEPLPASAPSPSPAAKAAADAEQEALDNQVLAAVGTLEGTKGARWDDILGQVATGGVTPEEVEEALNRLMDKGLIYEPTLGILRTT